MQNGATVMELWHDEQGIKSSRRKGLREEQPLQNPDLGFFLGTEVEVRRGGGPTR